MWTRAELKNRAKDVLRRDYWKAFLVSLILLFTGSAESSGPTFNYHLDSKDGFQNSAGFSEWFSQAMPLILTLGLALFLAAVAFRLFIGYPLEVGARRYFNQAAQSPAELECIGYAFNRKWYMNTVVTMLIKDLRILAWTLLLIIPGIIKSYAYRFVPYILADNPEMPHSRAIELSNQMTAGQKMNIFILDLSFLGWYLLGLLALVVGTLFVHPYVNSTMSELYAVLRSEAIQRGLTTQDELMPTPDSIQ